MTILNLVTAPDPLLSKPSTPVDKINADIQKLMDDMLETMYNEGGLGISAVQIGVLKRILVMDVEYVAEKCEDHGCGHNHKSEQINSNPIFMVNPVVIKSSKEIASYFEGCLSFPDFRTDIERPKMVTIEFLDYFGQKQIMDCDGILATCVQHEIDHLNGITLVDHLSKLKRDMVLRKMKKRKG